MKKEFNKWYNKNSYDNSLNYYSSQRGWDGCKDKITKMIKSRNKQLEYSWQHEDIDYLMEEITKL